MTYGAQMSPFWPTSGKKPIRGIQANVFSFQKERRKKEKKSHFFLFSFFVSMDSLALFCKFCFGIFRAVVTTATRKGAEYDSGGRGEESIEPTLTAPAIGLLVK